MPVHKGVMTYSRFFVTSPTPLSPEAITEKINLFRFRPLDPRGDDNETLGFCPFRDEFDDERRITERDFYFDGKIVLCMRLDTLTLPKDHLRALVRKSLQEYQREHKKPADRTVRKEIELAEAQGLRHKVMPKAKITESTWCQKSGELRIFSRAPKVIDRFLELFQQTFLLRPLRRDFPAEAFRFSEEQRIELPVNWHHEALYLPPQRTEVQ